jgi:DNA-directed RNA polymerase subunit E'/Rpb7
MFFHITLTKDILMHPSSFGRRLHDEVRKALLKEVEGTVDPFYGYVVQVTNINDLPLGEIREGGLVNFHVSYKAIIFRPFRNEVLEAVVSRVDQIGIHFSAGPLQGLIPKSDRSKFLV